MLDPRTPSVLDLIKFARDLVVTHFTWHCPHCPETCEAWSEVDTKLLEIVKDPKEHRARQDMAFISMFKEAISTHLKEKHA